MLRVLHLPCLLLPPALGPWRGTRGDGLRAFLALGFQLVWPPGGTGRGYGVRRERCGALPKLSPSEASGGEGGQVSAPVQHPLHGVCGRFWKARPPLTPPLGLSTVLAFLHLAHIFVNGLFISLAQSTQSDGPQSPVRPRTDAGLAHGVLTCPRCPERWRGLGGDRLGPLVTRCPAIAPVSTGTGELPAPEGTR